MKYTIPKIKLTMVREPATIQLRTPTDAASAIRSFCCDNPSTESFAVLYLDGRSRIISGRVVAMGGTSSLVLNAREVFQGACDAGASAIIVGHNHPSGNPEPSEADRNMTRNLVESGKVLGIPVMDHVIVTECGLSHSFMNNGEM